MKDTWLIADVTRFMARLGEKGIRTKQETIEHYTRKLQELWKKQSKYEIDPSN